uniref:Uncharacterized protein n=1 Tax=Mycena chlorophos TaxID=658473 RepID=A0ABQ0M358_MYCCL|nr:predicted protein [Mycena chlorophos]
MATIKTTTPALPDYITYRYANRLVYVEPAKTYEAAITIAKKEFSELADIPSEHISFNTVATVNRNEARVVRISESAWLAAVARQLCGGIIDILVTDPGAPREYLTVPTDVMSKEEIDILRVSRSSKPTPPPVRRTSSSPASRSNKSSKRASWLPRIGS